MSERAYNGNEWTGIFFAAIMLFWVGGAVAFGTLVMLGGQRAEVGVTADSNQTPVANSPQTE